MKDIHARVPINRIAARVKMTNQEFDFETWFDHLAMMVLDLSGFALRDPDCVREDYEQGRNLADVAEEIAAEYRD
jgi:hypothetical protein